MNPTQLLSESVAPRMDGLGTAFCEAATRVETWSSATNWTLDAEVQAGISEG